MRITDLALTKKARFSVFLDGEFACVLHADILVAANLSVGTEIGQEWLEELYRESQEKITRERAVRLLSGRSYTAQGLYEKLCAYGDEESAAAAVARMQELGLIDDRDYARRYAADCVNLKHYSHSRTARALAEKGIDQDIIEETLAGMEEDPEQMIAQIVRRRYKNCLDDEKGVRRTVSGLQRLGYRYGDIRRVLDELQNEED